MTKPKIILRTDDTIETIRDKMRDTTSEERAEFLERLHNEMAEIRVSLREITAAGDSLCDTYDDMKRIADIVETLDVINGSELN